MEALIPRTIYSLAVGLVFDFQTGNVNLSWYKGATTDISGGLDNLLLVDGESFFTLQSDTTNDVLLLA